MKKTSTDNGFAHVHQNCINQKWHQFFLESSALPQPSQPITFRLIKKITQK